MASHYSKPSRPPFDLTSYPSFYRETVWKDEATTRKSKYPSLAAWVSTMWPLIVHCIVSVAVALFVLVYIDSRHFNVTERTPLVQVVGGTRAAPFGLMQSDITTFLSSMLIILRCALTAWAASLCWRVSLFLMERRGLFRQDLKVLLKYGQLAPTAYSREWTTPIIVLLLLATLLANFSSPLLTGSITWVPSNQLARGLSLDPVYFDDVEDGTLTKIPDLYLTQEYERQAWAWEGVGFVGMGWGRDIEKGVLKRVSQSVETLAINSTVENITLPYYEVHSIEWIKNTDEISDMQNSGPLNSLAQYAHLVPVRVSLLPFGFILLVPKVVFNWSTDPLESTTFRDKLLLVMCHSRNDTSGFTNLTKAFPPGTYTYSNHPRYSFAFAWIDFSAGVGRCKKYQCVVSSPSTIQNVTAIELEPHQLTLQALMVAPVISFSLIGQNASLPSPWLDVNAYVEAVLVRSYSGAWTALNKEMTTRRTISNYVPSFPSLLARVHRGRVYIWLGIQLLVTLFGLLFIIVQVCLSKYPLIGDTTFTAFYLDTTGVQENDERPTKKNKLLKIEPHNERLKVKLE